MTEGERLAFLVCGALRREVGHLIRQRGWDADIHNIPALHHFYPKLIVSAVKERLEEFKERYHRIVVVYGDCGTAGALDEVLRDFPAVRPEGPHCYEMFGGADFARIADEEPGTYFLTDWLVRAFDHVVIQAMGLDRHPHLKDTYFGNYTQVVYFQQFHAPELDAGATRIAEYLGLPLDTRHVGLGDLETRLIEIVEGAGALEPD